MSIVKIETLTGNAAARFDATDADDDDEEGGLVIDEGSNQVGVDP